MWAAGELGPIAELVAAMFLLGAMVKRRKVAFELGAMSGAVVAFAPYLGSVTFVLVLGWLGFRTQYGRRGSGEVLARGEPYKVAIAGFIALVVTSITLGAAPEFHPERPIQILSAFFYAWLVHRAVRSERDLDEVLLALAACGLAVSFPELLRVLGGGAIHDRDASFGAGPILLGRMSGLGLVGLTLYWYRNQGRSSPRVYVAAIAVLVGGLIATGTRSAVVGLAIAGGVFLASRSRYSPTRKFLFMAPTILAAAWLAARLELRLFEYADNSGRLSQNLVSRTDIWAQAIRTITEFPLFGAGIGNFSGTEAPVAGAPSAHSFLLEVASESGLLAAALASCALALSLYGADLSQRTLLCFAFVTFTVSGHMGVGHHLFLVLAIASLRHRSDVTGPSRLTQPAPLQRYPQAQRPEVAT